MTTSDLWWTSNLKPCFPHHFPSCLVFWRVNFFFYKSQLPIFFLMSSIHYTLLFLFFNLDLFHNLAKWSNLYFLFNVPFNRCDFASLTLCTTSSFMTRDELQFGSNLCLDLTQDYPCYWLVTMSPNWFSTPFYSIKVQSSPSQLGFFQMLLGIPWDVTDE